MSKNEPNVSRRDFIARTAPTVIGAGGLLSAGPRWVLAGESKPAATQPPYEQRNRREGMSYAPLGRTNLMVSRLSIGGRTFRPRVLASALERGVNLVHGSHGYGTMGEQGKALKGHWDKVWYALKGAADQANVDECLKTLGRDHVDFVLPVFGDPRGVGDDRVRDGFEKLRKAGKVRMLGLTVHAKDPPAVVQAGVEAGFYDVILTMYQPSRKRDIDKVLAKAKAKNIGTISMKTIIGVKRTRPAQLKVVAAALAGKMIDTVLRAIADIKELHAYCDTVGKEEPPANDADVQGVDDPQACAMCGRCSDCPGGVAVQEIMRCMTYYAAEDALSDWVGKAYRALERDTTVASCLDCGRCESACSRALPIRRMLREAHGRWAQT